MNTSKSAEARLRGWKRLIYTDRASDRRHEMMAVLNSLILHVHPTRVPVKALRFSYTWGLGGISILLCLVLAASGILLMFRYEADVEQAYLSIQALETEVACGSLIRALHHWSANLLVITTLLHLVRVFLSGGFKAGRRFNWAIGVFLFVLVLTFNFTGYLLPWDQLAYWAVTVSTSIMGYVPLIGREIGNVLLGASEVGQPALRNFYALHVGVLPAGLIALVAYHVWRVRKDGGISQPEAVGSSGSRLVTTMPHLVRREVAVGAVVIAALVLFSMAVPAPLGGMADPLHSPNPAKAAWYFGGLQELLLHMETEAALLLLGILGAGVILLPYLDRRDADIGVYFRSPLGRQAALLGLVFGLNLVPAMVIADEYWIDWQAWLPGWPTLIANGLIPVLLILALLAGVYAAARGLLNAQHHEALVALFAFAVTGLVVLTIICALFRGANMDLVVPGGIGERTS